jgi:hypothetical protein
VCPFAKQNNKNDGKTNTTYTITQKNGSIAYATIRNSNIFLLFQGDPIWTQITVLINDALQYYSAMQAFFKQYLSNYFFYLGCITTIIIGCVILILTCCGLTCMFLLYFSIVYQA